MRTLQANIFLDSPTTKCVKLGEDSARTAWPTTESRIAKPEKGCMSSGADWLMLLLLLFLLVPPGDFGLARTLKDSFDYAKTHVGTPYANTRTRRDTRRD